MNEQTPHDTNDYTEGQSKAIRCAACEKRIRGHEPDLILQDLDDGAQRFFHTRCGGAAYAAVAEKLGSYLLTVRHVEAEAN